ncbi:hypothetical protein B0I35DRAFT_498578 [Stachybotrys elegans]|uniref:Rhodopsin domain-containing protein n=1 Tax=Stachybotrys elegans TaxID=80388 RepID=A0A8K0SFQ6_9HYPO|nr:hypothetical protein B0I35DRAFT_498578 [Stachybotrys elegans]
MSLENVEWEFDPSAPNNGPRVNIAVWSLFALSSIFIALRLFCKFKRHRGLWWDNYVLVASWIFFLAGTIQLSVNIAYGFGRPGANINPLHAYRVGLGGLIVGTMVLTAPVLGKISFILTLSRLSGPKLKIFLWVLGATMASFQLVALVVQWAQCTPLEKVWNPFMPEGECLPYQINLGLSMGSAAYSGVVDLILAAIPWFVLKDLQIKKREKMGIALAMSMGVVAAATAFAKCVSLQRLISSDFTLEGGQMIIWASTEIATTIIAASIPILRTLLRDLSTGRSYRNSGGYIRSTVGEDQSRKSRFNMHGGHAVTVVGGSKGPSSSASPDAASDKSILQGSFGKIMKTEEIAVDYGHSGGDGYEMQSIGTARVNCPFD